jgi:hypothetical protein
VQVAGCQRVHLGPAYVSTTDGVLSMLFIKSDMVPAGVSLEHADQPETNAHTQPCKVPKLGCALVAGRHPAVVYTVPRCMACTSLAGQALQKQ